MENKVDILDWIINWFEQNTTASRQELMDALSKNYFEKGWMDSFKFVSFIMEVEKEFDVTFSNDEFQNRDFSTIQGLDKIICTHMGDKK